MKKLFLLVLLLLSAADRLAAQNVPLHEIDLKRQKATFPAVPIFIKEIVDISGGDGKIGIGFEGISNKTVLLTVKDGIGPALTKTLVQPPEGSYRDSAIIRITGLRLNEAVTATSEKRFLELEAELAYAVPGGFKVYGPRRLTEASGGLDVTGGHGRAIIDGLEKLTNRLSIERFNGTPAREIAQDALRQPIKSHPITATTIADLPDGVYASYMDFRAAMPDTTLVLSLEALEAYHETNGITYHVATVERPRDVKAGEFREYWGIQRDGKTFMRVNRNFYELKSLTDGTLSVAVPGNYFDAKSGSGALMGALTFGIVGGIIGALLDDSARNANLKPRLFHFNVATGGFIDPDQPEPQVTVDGIIVKSYGLNPNTHPITIMAGNETLKLFPGEHAIIPRDTEVCFSVPEADATCTTLETDPKNPRTFYQLVSNKKGNFRFTWMADDDADSVYVQVESGSLKLTRMQ